MPALGQRQSQRQIAHGLQVQALALQLALGGMLAGRLAELHAHIATGPDQSLLVHKGQLFGGE